MTDSPTPATRYVCLAGVVAANLGNRFFTTHRPGEDPTLSEHGEVWYRILGYASTVEEAQAGCHGRVTP